MASSSDHAAVVLSGIIPNRRDLLDKATRQLTEEHFPERAQARLFKMLVRYSDYTGGSVMPAKYLDDLLRDADHAQQALYSETYELYAQTSVDDGEFAWSVSQLRELAAEKATGEAITEAMEILRNGKEIDRETVKGHIAARQRLLEAFQAIDRDLTMQESPEGDMREERVEIIADYMDRKNAREKGTSQGVLFGITELDRKVGGMQRGELIISAAYSSEGKTTLCTQTAWSAAVEQGKNVVFFTTETTREQVRRKLISRHSVLPQFGLPDGLNSRDLRAGTLPPDLEDKLREVADDLERNPAYGKLYIVQSRRTDTVQTIEQKLLRIGQEFEVDLGILDYLALIGAERKRNTTREELAQNMKDAKVMAVSMFDGKGIPFMSPWQISRGAREAASKDGYYTSASLSETAEATNSADLIISMIAPDDNTNRRAELQMQILKARDGETANGLLVDVDYATSWFRSKSLGFDGFTNSTTSSSSGSFSFDGIDSLLPS